MQAYVRCEEQFPASPWIRKLRADMLAAEGRTAEAVAELKTLIQASAPIPDLNYEVAMLYRRSGAFEEALQYFRRQGAASPHDERVAVGISACLLRLARYKELRTHLAPIGREIEPPEWALLDLASAEDKLGNPEGALRPLLQASKLYPKNPTVHFRLAGVYRRLNRQELADKEIKLFYQLKYGAAMP
jgi:Flp pilus assembly protein TadD